MSRHNGAAPRTSVANTVFDFTWTPPDELMALKPPTRYGRVEIDTPDGIVDGVIVRIVHVLNPPFPGGFKSYHLRISTPAPLATYSKEQLNNIAVKVCS